MSDEVNKIINFSSLSKEINDLSNDSKFTCKFCKSKQTGKLYYNVQFVCRENNYSNKLIVLYLSTFDDQGHGFFPITPLELIKNSSLSQKFNEIVKKIQEMDTYISVLVEAIKTGTNEGENIYRIIGDYQNTLA